MKLRNPWLIRVVAWLAAALIRVWMATIRLRLVNHDDNAHPGDVHRDRYIYSWWHETFLGLMTFQGRSRVRILISKHADGELIAQAARHLGHGVVRGSTNRGGVGALVELWDCSDPSHLVFTPDGPRGPRRRVQPGVVILGARSNLPIVPIGIGFEHAWRARSWDRFAIPRPFSRCFCVAGPALSVPADVDRDGIEHYRQRLEQLMLDATAEAERLAAGDLQGPHYRRVAGGPVAAGDDKFEDRGEQRSSG
jgi:lysophospholipid acyltransferase (LPLAT)-like uncharacterized protein